MLPKEEEDRLQAEKKAAEPQFDVTKPLGQASVTELAAALEAAVKQLPHEHREGGTRLCVALACVDESGKFGATAYGEELSLRGSLAMLQRYVDERVQACRFYELFRK